MKAAFPDALQLETLFVQGGAVAALEDAVDECIDAEGWQARRLRTPRRVRNTERHSFLESFAP